MNLDQFFSPQIYGWVVLPLLIMSARIFDVSIGTVRLMFVAKGYRYLPPVMGFFEVLIWIIVIGEIMKNLNNIMCYIAYASGFAVGNYVGILIESKLSLGMVVVRIITQSDSTKLLEYLKNTHLGVTQVDAEGLYSRVKILLTVVRRSDLAKVIDAVHHHNPKAFYSVEDIRQVSAGVFPGRQHKLTFPRVHLFRFLRKGK